MKSNEEILKGFRHNEEYPSYYHESHIEQAMDLARKDEAVEFQIWVRKWWLISKGKYRHRGDFYRNDKLVNESDLYSIFKQSLKNR